MEARRGAVYPQLNDESVIARIRHGKITGLVDGVWTIVGAVKTFSTPEPPHDLHHVVVERHHPDHDGEDA